MLPEIKDHAALWDMLDAARAIREFAEGRSYGDYLANRMLRGAVERHLEIIGEAARRITPGFLTQTPQIAWQSIIGLRNILAHEYGEVRHDQIWMVVTARIPELIDFLAKIVPEPPAQPSPPGKGQSPHR